MEVVLYNLYRRRKKRKYWVHPILQRRKTLGEFHRLVQELELERVAHYTQSFRMTPEEFYELLDLISPHISKLNTNWRECISAEERLTITLRYLATGDSYATISNSYRVGRSTVSGIIPEVCKVIWKVLQPLYLPTPTTEDWIKISNAFKEKWQFPNCIGAIDGKHVIIQCPANSGSLYYNYKGTYSVVLMAVVDADYRFRMINVGAYGRQSDGGIFHNSPLGQALFDGTLSLPQNKSLPGFNSPVPYVFIGDEAFPLRSNMMRPYPGRCLPRRKQIFNYHLSRARRVVENAFGILSQRFRVFLRPIAVHTSTVDAIVLASCCLHNYLNHKSGLSSVDDEIVENGMLGLPAIGRNAAVAALSVRDKFAEYFESLHDT